MAEQINPVSVSLPLALHRISQILGDFKLDLEFFGYTRAKCDPHRSAHIVYALDCSELVAFLLPDINTHNLAFAFERARSADSTALSQQDLLIIQSIFFDEIFVALQRQVLVLPPHWAELERQLRRIDNHAMLNHLPALENAFVEITSALASRLQDIEYMDAKYSGKTKLTRNEYQELADFLTEIAPTLSALMLYNNQAGLAKRLSSLLTNANIKQCHEFQWEQLGVATHLADRLRNVRPQFHDSESLASYLERARNKDHAPSQADAIAALFVRDINAHLAEQPTPHIQVQLVTRSEPLLDALRILPTRDFPDLQRLECTRHPRLLAGLFLAASDHFNATSTVHLWNTINTVLVTLEQFGRLTSATAEDTDRVEARINESSIVAAWRNFEKHIYLPMLLSRQPTELHTNDAATVNDFVDEEDAACLRRLFRILFTTKNRDELAIEFLEQSIKEVYKRSLYIGNVLASGVVQCRRLSNAGEVPVRIKLRSHVFSTPMLFYRLFTDVQEDDWYDLDVTQYILHSFDRSITTPEGCPAHPGVPAKTQVSSRYERFVAWSAVQAAVGNWTLANLYAEWALKACGQTATEATHEATLMMAMTLRRRELKDEKGRLPFSKAIELLDTSAAGYYAIWPAANASRLFYERGALLLEDLLVYSGGNERSFIKKVDAGFSAAAQAIDSALADTYDLVRGLQLWLSYLLAVRLLPLDQLPARMIDKIVLSGDVYSNFCSSIRALKAAGWTEDDFSTFTRGLEALGVHIFNTHYPRVAVSHSAAYTLLALHTGIQKNSRAAVLIANVMVEIGMMFERQANQAYEVLDPLDQGAEIISALAAQLPEEARTSFLRAMHCIALATSESKKGPVFERPRIGALKKAKGWLDNIASKYGSTFHGKENIEYPFYMELAFCNLRLGWETGRHEYLRDAEEAYKAITERYPDRAIALYRYATCLELNGKKDDGFKYLCIAFELMQEDRSIPARHWVRMRIARRLGERIWQQAHAVFEKSARRPADIETYIRDIKISIQKMIGVYRQNIKCGGSGFGRDERSWTLSTLSELAIECKTIMEQYGQSEGKDEVAKLLEYCYKQIAPSDVAGYDDIKIVFNYMRLASLMDDAQAQLQARQCSERVLSLYIAQGYTDKDPKFQLYHHGAVRQLGAPLDDHRGRPKS